MALINLNKRVYASADNYKHRNEKDGWQYPQIIARNELHRIGKRIRNAVPSAIGPGTRRRRNSERKGRRRKSSEQKCGPRSQVHCVDWRPIFDFSGHG